MATFSLLVEHRQTDRQYVFGKQFSPCLCWCALPLYSQEARQERGEERGLDSCPAPIGPSKLQSAALEMTSPSMLPTVCWEEHLQQGWSKAVAAVEAAVPPLLTTTAAGNFHKELIGTGTAAVAAILSVLSRRRSNLTLAPYSLFEWGTIHSFPFFSHFLLQPQEQQQTLSLSLFWPHILTLSSSGNSSSSSSSSRWRISIRYSPTEKGTTIERVAISPTDSLSTQSVSLELSCSHWRKKCNHQRHQ